jgi:tetratricopeptide (TPR) repeat protein
MPTKRFSQRERIRIYRMRAEVLTNIGDVESARRDMELAVSLAGQANDRLTRATCLQELAWVLGAFSDYDRVITLSEEALKEYRNLGDRAGEYLALGNLSWVASQRGDFPSALYFESEALARALGDRAKEATSYNALSFVYRQTGDFVRAAEAAGKALALYRELDDPHGLGVILNNLGYQAYLEGRYQDAEDRYREALEFRRLIGWQEGEATVLNNLALVAHRLGDLSLAQDHYETALRIYQRIGYPHGEAAALRNLAQVLQIKGEDDRAFRLLESALEIRRSIRDPYGEAAVLVTLGGLLAEGGRDDEAEKALTTGLALARSQNAPDLQAGAAMGLARLDLNRDRITQAEVWAREALKRAEALGLKPLLAEGLLLRARVSSAGLSSPEGCEWRSARETFDRSLGLFEELNQPLDSARVRFHLAEACRAIGEKEEAGRLFEESRRAFSSLGAKAWERKCQEALSR